VTAPQFFWPQIEGIDSSEARARLDGDLELFGELLARIDREFAALADAAQALAPLPPPALANRMHKLRSAAGALGAREIARMAAELESAALSNDKDRTCATLPLLGQACALLHRAAAPFLAHVQARADEPAANPVAQIEPAQLEELIALLHQHNLAAAQRFKILAPALRASLGAHEFDRLRALIDDLHYADAARMIAAGVR
jgi:HPt (histidine-containing phosphotransfer) domain-containing protein